MSFFTTIRAPIARLPKLSLWIGGFIIVAGAVVVARHLIAPPSQKNIPSATLSHVKVSAAANLSLSNNSTPIVGTVTSLNQATILSQTSGEIVSLPYSLGDRVTAGTVIAGFENNAQQAGVIQASGAVGAARTGLANAEGTFAIGSKITAAQAAQNVKNARKAFSNALQSAYIALDDAVHAKADTLFSNPRTVSAQLILIVPNSRLVRLIRQERLALQTTFSNIAPYKNDSSGSTLDARSTTMTTAANSVIQFLGNLATAVNETLPSQSVPATALAGYTVSLGAARAEANSALSGLIAAKSAYDNALANKQAATNATTNGTPNTIALAKARLTQASGAYGAARAALEKTIIRSPINGTIISMPITLGDYVPMFSPIAIVSNSNALYIKTFVTSDTARTLAAGDSVLINGARGGIVTFVAPSLDPLTHKREVKVGIVGSHRALANGETVLVTFVHTITRTDNGNTNTITVPLSAIKVTPSGPKVFTVSTTSTLVAHSVTIQNINGDSVSLRSGITSDTKIVLDARGLSSDQKVIIDTK